MWGEDTKPLMVTLVAVLQSSRTNVGHHRHWEAHQPSFFTKIALKLTITNTQTSPHPNTMLKKLITTAGTSTLRPWRTSTNRYATTVSDAVDSIVLRSLREHYLEVSKMTPPPKISPPKEFSVMKGALDRDGPVLKRNYGEDEEITITVMRLLNNEDDEDQINQLFLNVDVAKPGKDDALHFLVGLYPDAMGIHSVSMRPKLELLEFNPSKYGGPDFHDLGERTRDALHEYIEERGVNDSLFTFLQAWLYVKDHRNLMRWFKTVGSIISEKPAPAGK